MPLPRDRPLDIDYLTGVSFWERVSIRGLDECWPWLKSTGSHGYGQTWDGVTVVLAHRAAWVLGNGRQVPEGMTIDHTCRNSICCNPAHLRPLPNVDNATDNGQGLKTHCPRGHEYDDKNTYRDPEGHRRCRECARITKREWASRRVVH